MLQQQSNTISPRGRRSRTAAAGRKPRRLEKEPATTRLWPRLDGQPPRVYYLHPLIAGPLSGWVRHVEYCRTLGFDWLATAPLFAPGSRGDIFLTADHDALHPALAEARSADDAIAELAARAGTSGVRLMLDLVLDRVASESALVRKGWYEAVRHDGDRLPDPRRAPEPADTASACWRDPVAADALAEWWIARIVRLLEAGVAGFRCDAPQRLPCTVMQRVIAAARARHPRAVFLAWTPGLGRRELDLLPAVGYDGTFSSTAWWDGRAGWFVEESEALARIGPAIACPEAPFGPRLVERLAPSADVDAAYRRALSTAAATGNGLMVPLGFEFGARLPLDASRGQFSDLDYLRQTACVELADELRAANGLVETLGRAAVGPRLKPLTDGGDPLTVLFRPAANGGGGGVVLINPDPGRAVAVELPLKPLPAAAGGAFAAGAPLDGNGPASALNPGEVRVLAVERLPPVRLEAKRPRPAVAAAIAASRIVIEQLAPAVDHGRFAIKRSVGEAIEVSADIFADGHEVLAAELLWRAADESHWQRLALRPLDNDRWQGRLAPGRIGRHYYTVEAWWDVYGTFARDLAKKVGAGLDVTLEIAEGRQLIEAAQARTRGETRRQLAAALSRIAAGDDAARIDVLLAAETREAMAAADDRPFRVQHEPLVVEVETSQAGFASWYEMFPRSATDDPRLHGSFADVIARLPTIAAMGFDVLYFPPIHPIGTTNRKGRNNDLKAAPGDVGSPYAIGSPDGGHDSIHPALGSFDDFRRLREAAAAHGIELAIDFALQCSPDHPWLKQHPGWFSWRPDGSMRYAENPPKKYEDIVNLDFYAEPAKPDLWLALRDVVQLWIDHGVRHFRVDNPHTKPLPFWEWLIADIRAGHPEVIFLSEAFTRPKLMYRLAKLGFSQSYTYFTWRNNKRELSDYLIELTSTEVKEFFRPHFFVNTPDINPYFLQTSGRAGFLIRAALAATLSGLWGAYSGFELCEAAPLPGREEYLDSEKYEIRVRDFAAPGNIVAEIAMLNRLRKAHPALQSHLGLRFYNAFNDQVMVYGKPGPTRRDMVLVALSLDPHQPQEASFEVPLWEWGLPDHGSLAVEDLVAGHRFTWTGKLQRTRLDPQRLPFAIWRIAPEGGRP